MLLSTPIQGLKKKSKHPIGPPRGPISNSAQPQTINHSREEQAQSNSAIQGQPKQAISQGSEIANGANEAIAQVNRRVNTPVGPRKSRGISIKESITNEEEKIEQGEIDPSKLAKDNFSYSDFLKLWNMYTKGLESENMMLATGLQRETPKIEGNNIIVELATDAIKEKLMEKSEELLSYLRKKLNNYSITMEIRVTQYIEKKYYVSSQEKYLYLKEKNENIDFLIKELNLQIK